MSAAIADGPPRRVLDVLAKGTDELILPAPVQEELGRVLAAKLRLDAKTVEAIVGLVAEIATVVVEVCDEVEEASGDPDDDRILAAAISGGADVLVSGDTRHLLPLKRFRGMRIMRPQEFLAERP